ncbi:alpha/beta hydrolase [Streptomyces sp. A7024]|uniref:Alpha/beta hydrolase n=1 Tax=Streptomyces coryli TaxID=1128680 RepID=A0A6G4TUF5_9ACTN|nr:alpha/beta hydrolase [Streptomyces coryli]NGN62657.1 alpha/beta hydrolase [Streptomyces coryli]
MRDKPLIWARGPRRGATALLASVAALALVQPVVLPTTVAADTSHGELAPYYGQKISWKNCAAQQSKELREAGFTPPAYAKRLQCGSVKAPRIYASPGRGDVEIHMVRLPKTGDGERPGSLVLNFGGPGESGMEGLREMGAKFATLNQRYDLVAHDPRGVGASAPVECAQPDEADLEGFEETDRTPDNPTEAEVLAAVNGTLNEACRRSAGRLLPWVGTVASTRDLDVLRAALGDKKLNYLGFSYGTFLGANYLHKFPGNAGRVVLDGVENPTQTPREELESQAKAFDHAMDDFLADCAQRGARQCPLGTDPKEAKEGLEALFTALDGKTLPTDAGGLDQDVFVNAMKNAMYSKGDGWPALRRAFGALLDDDDGAPLAALGGATPGNGLRTADGGAGEQAADNSDDAFRAINCRDTSKRYGPKDYTAALADFTKASPLFGKLVANELLQCTDWPVAGDNDPHRVDAEGAPKALLVATVNDPATPYPGGVALAKALGNDSVELTYTGDGHGAYVTNSRCVHSKVEDFLFDGKLPKAGTKCN